VNKTQREVNFEEWDEVWLNIKNFWLLKGLSHKFLGPYVGPFKVLEKKFLNTYKLELQKILEFIPHFMFHFWSQSPMMSQGLIESTTQGPHQTWFIINQNFN
jgi:hypothetical protein